MGTATTKWNDATSSLKIGPTYYYALAYRSGSGDDVMEGPKTTDRLSVLRLRQLERSPEDLTTLRASVTAIHEGEYYNANNNDDTLPFDGNTGTFCDLKLKDGAIGVDLGEGNPYAVLACRVARRRALDGISPASHVHGRRLRRVPSFGDCRARQVNDNKDDADAVSRGMGDSVINQRKAVAPGIFRHST